MATSSPRIAGLTRRVRAVSRVYVEGFRGTSEVVQLFWIYFVLPALLLNYLGQGAMILAADTATAAAKIKDPFFYLAPDTLRLPLVLLATAASIIAKVTRDRMMIQLHEHFPVYGFAQHKGYGTEYHLVALREHGATLHHRRSFAPVRELFSLFQEEELNSSRLKVKSNRSE